MKNARCSIPKDLFEPWFYKVVMNHGRERLRKRPEQLRIGDFFPAETYQLQYI